MRQAIHQAASLLGPCFSISHLIGGPGQVFRVSAGRPETVQELLAAEGRKRYRAAGSSPADLVVVGNNPWPGDPMQSFKVLLHHRSASKPGGVLVGLFWTDADEIDRSFPRTAMRLIAATGSPGGWVIRRLVPLVEQTLSATGSPSAFMLRWARELVVDREVMVFSPPLHARIGPRLGPVRLFAEQSALWKAAFASLGRIEPCSPSHSCLSPWGPDLRVARRLTSPSCSALTHTVAPKSGSPQSRGLRVDIWLRRARSGQAQEALNPTNSKNRATLTGSPQEVDDRICRTAGRLKKRRSKIFWKSACKKCGWFLSCFTIPLYSIHRRLSPFTNQRRLDGLGRNKTRPSSPTPRPSGRQVAGLVDVHAM